MGRYSDVSPQVEATTATHKKVVQYQVSDWDFIVSRAERVGMYVSTDNGELRIGKPSLASEPVAELEYGSNVFDADLVMDASTQFKKAVASTWDPASQEVASADVDTAAAPDQGNIDGADLASVSEVDSFEHRHAGALETQDVDAWAEATMTKSRFARIRGTVRFQGNEAVRPGSFVTISGMGERFNGTAFVSGVRHAVGGGDWHTVVQLGLRAEWHYERFDVSQRPGVGFQPAINGLQIGVVRQLQDDPAGEDRILVRLPMIDATADGTWCRLATLDAGDGRGSIFRPELNDEVVVGFFNDDPQEAVLLGMLHSSAKPAPIAGHDDNHEKGFVTRSEMKVIFNDDDPSTTIETPNGNKIIIHDGEGHIHLVDETGNSIKMSSDGVVVESPKDISLKATGDVKIEGMNVTVKAKSAATMEGSSGAAVKSGGTTEVKGSLVQIN